MLERLIAAGVDVFRLNLSHGAVEDHLLRLHAIREVATRLGAVVGVLADLPGPKVRAGQLPEDGVVFAQDAEVRLMPGNAPSTAEELHVDYPSLLADLRPGDRVLIGDGAISLRVEAATPTSAVTRVVTGGRTQGRPCVHIPA
jgi:pyruvate kinase